MRLAITQLVPDPLNENCTKLFADLIFALFGSHVRIHLPEFLRIDEMDLVRQVINSLWKLIPHLMLHVLDDLENDPDSFFQEILISLVFGNDFLPVPLVNINAVKVIEFLIPADGVHICVEAFTRHKAVFAEGHSLPLRERLHNLQLISRDVQNVERHLALYSVQVVI